MVTFLKFSVLFRAYLFVRALLGKTPSSRHTKPGRTHWSRSGHDPGTLERVAGAQTFLFPAGVDMTISLFQYERSYFVRTYR